MNSTTQILQLMPLSTIITKTLNGTQSLTNDNQWETSLGNITVLDDKKWIISNEQKNIKCSGKGAVSLIENWLNIKDPQLAKNDDDMFDSNYYVGLSMLEKAFKSEIEAVNLYTTNAPKQHSILNANLSRMQEEGLEQEYEIANDIEHEYDYGLLDNDGIFLNEDGTDEFDRSEDFAKNAKEKIDNKKQHILKLLSHIDPNLRAKIEENLDSLITTTVLQSVAAVANYEYESRESADEWAIGLGIAQTVIKETFLPEVATKKPKFK